MLAVLSENLGRFETQALDESSRSNRVAEKET
jgi:hypothetical protein